MMPYRRFRSGLIVGLGLAPGLLVAQQKPETAAAAFSMSKEYRAVQLSALQSQRKLLLSFADSMPERLYRDKVTPIQRSFAEQVHHVAFSSLYVSHAFIAMTPFQGTDTAKVLNSRAELKGYINSSYDELEGMLKSQTDADRDVRVKFFDGNLRPKWEIWDELNQHAFWTAGQVVANFRKQGMAPPSFLFF